MSVITGVCASKKCFPHSLSLLCHTVDPLRAGKYKQHESFLWFSARAATPFSDRKGHNDRSVSLWQQSVKFRGVPHPGRCHEFLMFTLNWKKSQRKMEIQESPTVTRSV